jgi:hypothetical protein
MSTMPKLGLRLHGGLDPHRCVELAEAAEANHFASVWFAENPFERGVRPPLPLRGRNAAHRDRHRRVESVHPASEPDRHGDRRPRRAAQGRANLGIGSGIASAIGKLGVDNSGRSPRCATPSTSCAASCAARRSAIRARCSRPTGSSSATRRRPDLPLLMAARGDKRWRSPARSPTVS